jgi:hypothetical protein
VNGWCSKSSDAKSKAIPCEASNDPAQAGDSTSSRYNQPPVPAALDASTISQAAGQDASVHTITLSRRS